jgi:hypothetical protein
MANTKYKLVLKPEDEVPNTGLRTLNGLSDQPLVDTSGNIDMCGNYLLVKNIEAGTQDFTTNGEKGIINVFSNSTNTNTSCINFNHNINNIGGNNRRYCSFQPNGTNFIAGSITGNPATVSYNTTSDERAKNLVIDDKIVDNNSRFTSENNGAYHSYILRSDPNPAIGKLNFSSWLDSVNALNPLIYQFKSDVVVDTSFNFDISLNDTIERRSVNYQGFFAHDVQAIYPPAVTGMRNQTDSNGDPVYQQLDMTKLIPMMVGAIQELSAKVSVLEASMNEINAKIEPNRLYTSPNGLFSYVINNTNSTYNSNEYYQPIKDAIEKWDSLVGIPTIYTTNSNYIYTALDININFSELGTNILGGAYITNVTSPGGDYKYGNTFATAGVFDLNTLHLTSMKNNTYNNGYSQLYYTALHEIGHVLGIGPLWSSPNIISSIPRTQYEENGQTKYYYTGQYALTEYKSYFPSNISQSWIGIPIEDDGEQGTQNVHPEEGDVNNGSISLETRTINGVIYYGLNDELMTGWSEQSVEMPLSRVTLGFLQDIGYNVNYALADDYTATY